MNLEASVHNFLIDFWALDNTRIASDPGPSFLGSDNRLALIVWRSLRDQGAGHE